MRPLRLVMRAFGPYVDEVSLDFAALAGRSLLLIHGPTGAGKTSILDAICFALFGETAASDRPVKKVRSDFAEASATTEVTFDFALGDRVFRVHRCAEHPRPGAATARPGSVTLWQLERGSREPMESGSPAPEDGVDPNQRQALRVIATKTREVADAIAALLGFHVEQFRQVVLIPQGEFRRLLLADSKDREKILEALFNTELYRRIEDALKDARNDLAAEIKREARAVEVLLEQAGVGSLDLLRERAADQAAHLAACNDHELAARAAEHEASARAAAAERAAAAAAELGQAETDFEALAGRQAEQDGRRRTLQRARAAQAVAGQQAAYQAATAQAAAATAAAHEASRALALAQRAQAAAAEARIVQEGLSAQREEARTLVRRLGESAARAARAADLRKRLSDAEVRLADALGAAGRSDREMNYELARCDELERELVAVRELLAQAEARRAAVREATEIATRLGALAESRSQRITQSVAIGGLEAELGRVEEELGELRGRERDARARWAAGQAAALALTLEQGRPCPVCGSPEHPSPAIADGKVIADADLDVLQRALDEAERRRQTRAAELATAREQGAALRARIEELAAALGDWAAADRQRAEAALAAAREALIEVGHGDNRRRQIEEAMAARRAAIEEAAAGREQATGLAERARLSCAELRGQLEEAGRDGAVEEGLADAVSRARSAADELARAQARASELDKAAEEAAAADIRATASLASARENDARAAEQAALAGAALETARDLFDAALLREGFAGQDEASAARMAGAELDALEAGVAAFDAALGAAASRVERARAAAAAGAALTDVEAARQGARTAKQTFEEAVAARAAAEASVGVTQDALRGLDGAAARLDALEKRYQVVGHVADVAGGRNDTGISLMRFVLAALLDDVLVSASERLRRMSQQRFALARAGDRRDRRSSGGLDLEVYDAHTGVARPVATLSGGESFLASLSLALGLADVVQSYAGGIRLETIFIDEGFGTLDPEALDLAMRTLEDLQSGGRLVGIISHVPELKERVSARLEVTPGARGSSARFVLG